MLLNGYYIDHVNRWTKKSGGNPLFSEKRKYVKMKNAVEYDTEHKLIISVKNENTVKQLTELFKNADFNIVHIDKADIVEYNGAYRLMKGNFALDGGKRYWTGTIWLEGPFTYIRYSARHEPLDNNILDLALQTATLPNGIAELGTWNTTTTINCTTDMGRNIYSFGYEYWSYIDFESTIQFNSLTAENFGLIFCYLDVNNYYFISIDSDTNSVFVKKRIDGADTILFISDTSVPVFVLGTAYRIKIKYAAGKIEVYFDRVHLITLYDYEIVGGKCGIYDEGINNLFTNIQVDSLIPLTYRIPAGHVNYKRPMPNRYTSTNDGTLQNFVNFEEEPMNKLYSSRMFSGEMRVWDTIDNDFSNIYVPPQPAKWVRVYDKSHDFIGPMYIENGQLGLLFKPSKIYTFIYDQPYKKGSKMWLDFKQYPNYVIWNDAFNHRKHQSLHQSFGNWIESGLEFEAIGQADDTDSVKNVNPIPELTSAYEKGMGFRNDFRIKPKANPRVSNGRATNGNVQTIIAVDQSTSGTNSSKKVNYDIVNNNISILTNSTNLLNSDNNEMPIDEFVDITVIDARDFVEGGLLYKNGLLLNRESANASDYINTDGQVSIGNTPHTIEAPFNGEMSYNHLNLISNGKTYYRQNSQPLVYHSLDERTWDTVANVFVDQGSKNVNLSTGGTPFIDKTGRYNEAISFLDASNDRLIAALTTELDGLDTSGYTIEFWMKFTDTTVAINQFQHFIDLYDSVGGGVTGNFFLNWTGAIWQLHYFTSTSAGHYLTVTLTGSQLNFITDLKWHHFAYSWDGTNKKMYLDGIELGSNTPVATGFPHLAPDSLDIIGEMDTDCSIDEIIISDYAKLPHEFGVYIPEIYQVSQWYSRRDFQITLDNTIIRNSHIVGSLFELDIIDNNIVDRVNKIVATRYSNTDLAPAAGGSGLGLQSSSSGNTGLYFIPSSTKSFMPTEDFTVQFHFIYTENVALTNYLIHILSATSTPFSLILGTDDKLATFEASAMSFTSNVDASTVLSINKLYEIAYVFTGNGSGSGTVTIYLDRIFYRSYTYTGMIIGNDYQFSIGHQNQKMTGVISNVIIHQEAISKKHLGFITDTTPMPTYYGYFIPVDDTADFKFNNYILKSLSPDLVEIDAIETNFSLPVDIWMESSNPFVYFDMFNNGAGGRNEYGIKFVFDAVSKPRILLCPALGSVGLIDSLALTTTTPIKINYNDTKEPANIFLALDHERSNMVFAGFTTHATNAITMIEVFPELAPNKIIGIKLANKSYQAFAWLPLRDTNIQLIDATSFTAKNYGSYLTGGVYYSVDHGEATSREIVNTSNELNYKKFPAGIYYVGVSASSDNLLNWEVIVYDEVALENVLSFTGNDATLTYINNFANIMEFRDDNNIYLAFKNTAHATDSVQLNVMFIVPLSNGFDGLLDLLRQSMVRTYKQKVLQ